MKNCDYMKHGKGVFLFDVFYHQLVLTPEFCILNVKF